MDLLLYVIVWQRRAVLTFDFEQVKNGSSLAQFDVGM